jgi:phage terminase large subunit-like protein
MARHPQLKQRPFAMPLKLFPLAVEPETALDLIPIVPDQTGRGARAWRIFSQLPITEGEHAGKRVGEHSPPWQERLVKLIFGHTDELGRRVLREIAAFLSKKNGKSAFCAMLAITKLLLEEEQRELVVCLAANRLQARLVFDFMTSIIAADGELSRRFEPVDTRNLIKFPATNSQVRAISAEMASTVGLNPSLAVVDELHLLGGTPKGQKLVNQLRTGSVARPQPLLISISTAPVSLRAGIFESTYQKAKRVFSGEEDDPRFFPLLCEVPAHLDPEDPANWHWSNPSLGYTVTVERLQAGLDSARSDPAALRDFRSQNLNIQPDESAGVDRWMTLAEWDGAADTTLTLESLIAESAVVWAGTDAGGLDDLSAVGILGRTSDDRFLFWAHQWLSTRGYNKRKSINDYDSFVAAGELTLFDGGGLDLVGIRDTIALASESGKLGLIGIDAYGASDLSGILSDLGVEVQSVPQGWRLTPAIAWVERRVGQFAPQREPLAAMECWECRRNSAGQRHIDLQGDRRR